jgi:hypothetical protein
MANIFPFDTPPQQDVRTTEDGICTWVREHPDHLEVGGQAPCAALSEEWIAGAHWLELGASPEARERKREMLLVSMRMTLDFIRDHGVEAYRAKTAGG